MFFAESSASHWCCLVITWSVSKHICSSQLALRCAAVWTEIWSVWRGSNEERCFVPLFPRKHFMEYLSNLFYREKLYHYNYRFITQPYSKYISALAPPAVKSAQNGLHVRQLAQARETIYNVLNMDNFLTKTHWFTTGGLYSPHGAVWGTFYHGSNRFIRLLKNTPTYIIKHGRAKTLLNINPIVLVWKKKVIFT